MSADIQEIRAGLASIAAFDVVGISIVAENNEEAAENINALWERFFEDSIGQQIENKSDDVIYAVYSDYEGDHTDPYRLTIGYRVTSDETAEGMHRVSIQDQEYAVMSAAGEQPKALIETWQAIWSGDLPRSFKTDFEIYGPRFFEDGVHEILVHVGVDV